MRIIVGQGSCGIAAGAMKVYDAIEAKINSFENVNLGITGCIGMCYLEPIVDVYEGDELFARFVKVKEADAERILKAVSTKNLSEVADILIADDDKAFLSQQTRIALRNCGIIDPTSIDAYINAGGYEAIKKVLGGMTQDDVIDVIKTSGLAGRGGAGFPTWFKWNAAKESKGEEKYLICNADEGDPGAFMDRAVIESDPHTLIEGMLIGAYTIGAKEAVV
ncbi:MAG: NADH-quinone oxidoreductase subunit F, partial [Clostridia bacterium]|nr:NADH-quinone oxidoreductase subunit F [Clostridia bacterium]